MRSCQRTALGLFTGPLAWFMIEAESFSRLPSSMLQEALASGATPVQTWAGGRQTDLSRELGDEWLWGSWFRAEPDWLASSYQYFASTPR